MNQLSEAQSKGALQSLKGTRLAGKPSHHLWDVYCQGGCLFSIQTHKSSRETERMKAGGNVASRNGTLMIPSLCHPHIHLDKCFLLSHPKFSDLKVQSGDFAEALSLTNKAKARFEHDDLMERGRALIEESINFGVTSMRAFVEVDLTVELKCLEAGLELKEEFKHRCHIQICAFAQDPLFSFDSSSEDSPTGQGLKMRSLFESAVSEEGVDVVGSTPYVEHTEQDMKANISWMMDLAIKHQKFLDFHLDYNLDGNVSPMVWEVISVMKRTMENFGKNTRGPTEVEKPFPLVTLGHCTRLTLFTSEEWELLRDEIQKNNLPISFVGLPTSDLFMMGRPDDTVGCGQRVRGTLQIPQMIRKYGLDCAMGINNVGNAFTPQGNSDPLALASLGVGIYQAGTQADAELLLECVSSRARKAIGLGSSTSLELKEGDPADFIIFGTYDDEQGFRSRLTVYEVVLDAGRDRVVFKDGKIVSKR